MVRGKNHVGHNYIRDHRLQLFLRIVFNLTVNNEV